MERVILNLFELTTNLKIYHWKTTVYSEHIACDELYNKLVVTMDRMAEVYLGKVTERFEITDSINIMKLNNGGDVKLYLHKFVKYFEGVNLTMFSDLENIRTESLADCNRFIYLLSFK